MVLVLREIIRNIHILNMFYGSHVHWWTSTIPRLDVLPGDIEVDPFIIIAANIVDYQH